MRHQVIPTRRMIFFSAWVLMLSILLEPSQINAQQSRKGISASKPRKSVTQVRFASGNSTLNIPLEIDNNIILMRVRVNNSKPLKFIFDTGASSSVINSRRAAELGLKPQGEARGHGTGGKFRGSYTKGVSLSVEGTEVSHQLIALLPFPAVSGFEFDGIIGYDFINQFVVEIDYQNKIMNLYNPRTYAYSGRGEVIPFLLDRRKTPLVHTKIIPEGRLAPVAAKLEVDTGADGTFVISSQFVRKKRLTEAILKTTQSHNVGAGGEEKLLVGRVKAVRLGRLVFDNPPVGLSQDTEDPGAGEENHGLIGGEIFRRFKVILDYSRKRMILEPNSDFDDPYEVDN